MPHIHSEPGQHDHTTSAYIVRLDAVEPTIMLHRHKKLNQYLQFGGHIELNEDPWEALTHELAEESGYKITSLKILQPKPRLLHLTGVQMHPLPVSYLTHKFPGLDHYHTDTAFGFVAEKPPENALALGESEEITLFTSGELSEINSSNIPENVREIALFVLDTCLKKWEIVSL